MNRQSVDTVIFDVGGVLIGEYDKTGIDVQQRVGLDDETFGRVWPEIVQRYGTGHIDEETVWQILADHGGQRVDVSENVMGQPFAEALTLHEDVFREVRELGRRGFALGILSNTIAPHVAVNRQAGVYEPFGDAVYLSNEIGYRKPDLAAYEYALEHMDVRDPARVLYVDDRVPNLAPAEALGMQTLLAKSEAQIAQALRSLRATT